MESPPRGGRNNDDNSSATLHETIEAVSTKDGRASNHTGNLVSLPKENTIDPIDKVIDQDSATKSNKLSNDGKK